MFPTANPPNNVDSAPIIRALFVQLVDWAVNGVAPEPSSVPRRSDGTAISREAALRSFTADKRPDPSVLPYTPAIDPRTVEWPLPLGDPLIALVSAIHVQGNETAGIRLPAIETGVAIYTGWNPRRHIDGLPDVLYDLVGSRLPRREIVTAPIENEIRRAAEDLVRKHFLLELDLEAVIDSAMADLADHDDATPRGSRRG